MGLEIRKWKDRGIVSVLSGRTPGSVLLLALYYLSLSAALLSLATRERNQGMNNRI
ncbi:hypothetical protein NEUTE1DRAFT_118916 [Neurospora tetrasperma FGSC 2508]|uniref:Uncharacterized protein n=1 Tax=Neurospora tetrasperma (strain FGSC 2508 / ATCC MYA-4615 / P0657) TaxID=510951 RepID=F8N4W8_NEUT8|nr:uncharacterized protein NEUTE1DRAFT_118916 [Neurospora tetrasperma FGSC 2508]EGO52752.1 hypothetical protein NEUTE1DRAFT_118916 [Neurospora tetrasperma FGSC 2508]